MTTTPDISKIDRYKLETAFYDDYVIHTTYKTDLAARQRRIAVETKWTEKKDLGSGGYGIVSLQEQEGGQLRAVKRLPRGMGKTDYSQELKALSKLSDVCTPQILKDVRANGKDHQRQDLFVRFFGWYENRYFIFIAMEYIEYGDLSQYIKTTEARSNCREITRQLLEGLAVLHERKICHRDLKPQNILVASLQPIWVKIADFGVSKYMKDTELHTRLGTSGYLAPEILGLLSRGNSYTKAVDIWALGCVIYEILTLQIPFIECTSVLDTELSGVALGIRSSCLVSPTSPLQTDITLLQRFCLGKTEFPVEVLQRSQVSSHDIEFVKSLLVADPESRLSATDALQSPWLLGEDNEINKYHVDHEVRPIAQRVTDTITDLLAIAIDFGVMHTSIAYMRLWDLAPTMLIRWPGCGNFMLKVPTVLRYIPGSQDFEWGFVADRAEFGQSILFRDSLGTGDTYPDMSGKSAYDMIGDFLNAIYDHLRKELAQKGLDGLEMEFSFTYPHTYSDPVVEEFRSIILGTSFGKHKYQVTMTEDQAMVTHAMYCCSDEKFSVNEGIILCNVGHDTVDVGGFQVLQLGRFPVVGKIGITNGAPGGFIYIEKSFEDLLTEKGILQQLSNDEKYKLWEEFELRVESFANDGNRPFYYIELPRDGIRGDTIIQGYIQISRETMVKFFEPLVAKTLSLLKEAMKRCHENDVRVGKIILAGKLGSNIYLQDRIKAVFCRDPVRVLAPPDMYNGIVFGCVRDHIRNLSPRQGVVEQRSCPAHYGIIVSQDFDRSVHDQADCYKDTYTSSSVAKNQIIWLINKGRDNHPNTRLTIPRLLRRRFKELCVWEDVLVRCDADEPPKRLGPDVKVVCTLRTDMRGFLKSQFGKKRYRGLRSFYEASYLVNVIIQRGELKLESWYRNSLQSHISVSWESDGSPIRDMHDQFLEQPFEVI